MERNSQPRNYRIVIVGAGFAGLVSFMELQKKALKDKRLELVLLSPKAYQDVRTEMDCVADLGVSSSFCKLSFEELMNPVCSSYIAGTMEGLDPAKKTLYYRPSFSSKDSDKLVPLEYSQLIIACGAEAAFPPVEGLQKEAFPMWEVSHLDEFKKQIILQIKEAALYLKGEHVDYKKLASGESELSQEDLVEKVDELLTISIIGAGATGVELIAPLVVSAKEYAQDLGISPHLLSVQLFDGVDTPLPEFSKKIQKYAKLKLEELGVQLYLGSFVDKVDAHWIYLKDGRKAKKGSLAYAGGARVSKKVQEWNLALSKSGRIQVDNYLQVKGHKDIWALGDCASFAVQDGQNIQELPMLAQHAMRQAAVVSYNAYEYYLQSYDRLVIKEQALSLENDKAQKKEAKKKYNPSLHGQFVSIGENYALGWAGAKRAEFFGRPASVLKRMTYALYWKTLAGSSFATKRMKEFLSLKQ